MEFNYDIHLMVGGMRMYLNTVTSSETADAVKARLIREEGYDPKIEVTLSSDED